MLESLINLTNGNLHQVRIPTASIKDRKMKKKIICRLFAVVNIGIAIVGKLNDDNDLVHTSLLIAILFLIQLLEKDS